MKHTIRRMTALLGAGVILTASQTVGATGSHSSTSLFDFHSGQDEYQEKYDTQSQSKKTEAPISKTINTGSTTVKRMIVKTTKPLSAEKQKELLGKYGTFNRSLSSVNAFSAYIPVKNVETLLRKSAIDKVYIDSVVTSMGYAQPSPRLTVSAPEVWEKFGVKGDGVGVAVLDTGIYPHKDISSIVAFKDMVNGKTSPYDDNGHGTHVSGIISGNGMLSDGKYKGVSPMVDIVSVKVLDSNEKGYISNVIGGIDWVITNKEKYNIKVMNLSLGTTYSGEVDPLIEAVEKASRSGIFVVVAAGNNGYGGKVTSPAVAPSALAVGSTYSNNTVTPLDDVIASFSVKPQTVNGTVKPEIFAPGQDIVSLLAPEGTRAMSDRGGIVDGWYYKTSGTSMSAPVVSASAALLYNQNPSLNPSQVKQKITESAISVKGIDVLNIAKGFGITPNFEETLNKTDGNTEQKTSNLDIPTFSSEPPSVDSVSDEIGEPSAEEDLPQSFIPNKNDSDAKKEDPPPFQSGMKEESSDKKVTSLEDTSEKEMATLPEIDAYKVNNGYPFVKETYEKNNILESLLKNSVKYKNENAIKHDYENVQDIIKLFNLINRSFTKEDFLYFEQRLKN